MKYLGYANGWDETPACVKESREKGHKVVAETTGRCETTYTCEEGGWYYKVDSSD